MLRCGSYELACVVFLVIMMRQRKRLKCFVQAEDGIRDLVRSRGLGDVYKRQGMELLASRTGHSLAEFCDHLDVVVHGTTTADNTICLLYTSDAADERSSVDLGGRRIIKKKTRKLCNSM